MTSTSHLTSRRVSLSGTATLLRTCWVTFELLGIGWLDLTR